MEGNKLVLTNNSLCLFCSCKVKHCKNRLFPLHHLTSKINTNLGNVFKDIVAPEAPLPVLDRMELMVVACKACAHLCEEFLYKYQDGTERENCLGSILNKMGRAGLEDKYKEWSPLAVFYSGIVNRLRKEIIEKLQLQLGERSSQSATETLAGVPMIPKILNIPDLPIDKICSYLSLKDIKNLSSVSTNLRKLVLRSLINSSTITLKRQSRIPALIAFIDKIQKDVSNNSEEISKKNVNLSVKCGYAFYDDTEESRSAILGLFQACGAYVSSLTLLDYHAKLGQVALNGRGSNSIPSLGMGKELFLNMKELSISLCYRDATSAEEKACNEQQIKADLLFIKVVFENAPVLKKLTLIGSNHPLLFELIGRVGQRLDILETVEIYMTDVHLRYLHSLNLKKVVLDGFYVNDPQSFTHFLESQADTLKYLELDPCGGTNLEHFEFPRMKSLETLKIICATIINIRNLAPISYQAQLPRLKEIELDGVRPNLPIDDGKPTESVRKLSILDCSNFESGTLTRAAIVFKGLTKLEIPVAKDLFNCWKKLVSLEELTLHPCQSLTLVDKIICGISVSNYGGKIVSDKDIRRYAAKYEKVKTERSIALLTRLKLLRLNVCETLRLGDVGCKLVLMEMESLKCIDFVGAHPCSVGASSKVLDKMGEKMDLMFGDIGKSQ